MDEDEEDFIFYGTPIGREEETSARKRKAAADAGQLRTLPPWKQEVRDEEGRRRFHGAFTGGFSAGFYNTVGSKEGWTPQSFTSSRKNRAEVKQQSVYNFLDEDEKEEMQGHALETSSKFDTFGFTAAEVSRKQAEKDQQKRPSIIPGSIPDEIVIPAMNSIGVKLLVRMGWRHGHSTNDTRTSSLYDALREARKAFLAFSGNEEMSNFAESESESFAEGHDTDFRGSQSTPVFVLNPKQDLHGLGYDPFKHAPEFRERKRLRASRMKDKGHGSISARKENLFSSNSGKVAPGFGIGALEELDIEDEDIYDSGFEIEETCIDEVEPPLSKSKDVKLLSLKKEQTILSGFKPATNSDYKLERFQPPDIPPGFQPYHKFLAPLNSSLAFCDIPPPEVPPPDEHSVKLLVEGFAALVSRCGKLFEDLSKEKNKGNPLFCFLYGGNGCDYYARKLWEEQQKRGDQKVVPVDTKSNTSVQKMTAEIRGRALGEKPLEKRSNSSVSSVNLSEVHLQSNLSDNFVKPSSHIGISEFAKPFKDDPAKQERFEQFLKDKFEGGLRSTYAGGTSSWSETDRARERLDFEAILEAVKKERPSGSFNQQSVQQTLALPLIRDTQFISGGSEMNFYAQTEEKITPKIYQKREEFQWRPAPILCKRFDIVDPFMGKPPPLPKARSRMESFVFTSDFVKSENVAETAGAAKDSLPSRPDLDEIEEQITGIESKDKNVHKPVDLYKAIFSDDDDDNDTNGGDIVKRQSNDPEKKIEGVNTTLNRLMAGDFLESLGKELGLGVPTDEAHPLNKNLDVPREITAAQGLKTSSEYDKFTSKSIASNRDMQATAVNVIASAGEECDKQYDKLITSSEGDGPTNPQNRDLNTADVNGHSGHGVIKGEKEKIDLMSRRHTTHLSHKNDGVSSDTDSSDDKGFQEHRKRKSKEKRERKSRKKRSHSRPHLTSSSDSDSSRDYRSREQVDVPSKRHKTHSRHHHNSVSDTSPSTGGRHHVDSSSKADRRSSKEKDRKHSKHHRQTSRKHSARYSDYGVDGSPSHDRQERKKLGNHYRDSTSR